MEYEDRSLAVAVLIRTVAVLIGTVAGRIQGVRVGFGVCIVGRWQGVGMGRFQFHGGRLRAVGAMLAVCAVSCGCLGPTARELELERALDAAQISLKANERVLAERDATIGALREQIKKDRPFQGVGVDRLFTVDRIEIVSRSGGADFDGVRGDDGVVLYVRPVDRDGDVIKAAGAFEIQLVDLDAAGGPKQIGLCRVEEPEELARAWYGGMLTNHYTLRCPFADGSVPSGRAVLAQVTFVDFLTGRVHTATGSLQIDRAVEP